jgi:hypothetical protein
MKGIFPSGGQADFLPNVFKIYPDMIKEFAIQPEVMATWSHFRELRADFEVGLGRLISRYPKTWTRDVCAQVDRNINPEQGFGDVRASAIKNFVTGEKHRFIPARGRDFNPGRSWLENCEGCKLPNPFHAIVAQANPRNAKCVLIAGDFDRSQPPFAVDFQDDVLRDPEDMAKCGELLLDVCEELLLVDFYFSPGASRHGDTFRAILEHAARRPRNIRRIEIHTNQHVDQRDYERAFAGALPPQSNLHVFQWSEPPEGLHARYLLTDLGGIKFDWGFDKGQLHTQLNEVILLQHQRWTELQARYSAPPSGCILTLVKSTR